MASWRFLSPPASCVFQKIRMNRSNDVYYLIDRGNSVNHDVTHTLMIKTKLTIYGAPTKLVSTMFVQAMARLRLRKETFEKAYRNTNYQWTWEHRPPREEPHVARSRHWQLYCIVLFVLREYPSGIVGHLLNKVKGWAQLSRSVRFHILALDIAYILMLRHWDGCNFSCIRATACCTTLLTTAYFDVAVFYTDHGPAKGYKTQTLPASTFQLMHISS